MKDREDLLDEIIGVNRQVEAVSVMLRHLLRANQKTGEYTNTDVICQVLLAIEDMSDRIDTAATKLADGQTPQAPVLVAAKA